jgi:hypothetical protein
MKPDDTANSWFSNDFYSVASTNWSHSSIEMIEFKQPWDAACDIDYITIQTFGHSNTLVTLQFQPVVTDRTYTPLFSTDLGSRVWLPLTDYPGPWTNGSQVIITDTNAVEPQKFYRIQISLP